MSGIIPNEALAPESTWRSSQHEGSLRADENQRYVRSDAPHPESYTSRKRSTRSSTPSSSGGRHTKRTSSRSRRAVSEPVIDLFGQDWLQDPNCVGSSVAAMGEEDPSNIVREAIDRRDSIAPCRYCLPGVDKWRGLVENNSYGPSLRPAGHRRPRGCLP